MNYLNREPSTLLRFLSFFFLQRFVLSAHWYCSKLSMTSIRTFGSPTLPTQHLDADPSAPAAGKPWAPVILGELVDPLDPRPGSTTTSPSVTTDFGFSESGTSSRTSAQESSPRAEPKYTSVEGQSVPTSQGTDQVTTTTTTTTTALEKKAKRKSVPWTISMRDLDTRATLAGEELEKPAQRFIPVRTSSKPFTTLQHRADEARPRAVEEREKRRPSDQTMFSSGFSLTRLTDDETGNELSGAVSGKGKARAEEVTDGSILDRSAPREPRDQGTQAVRRGVSRNPRKEPTKPPQNSTDPEAGLTAIAVPLRHRRRTKKLQKAAAEARFLVEAERLPTAEEIQVAAALQVFAVDGKRVAFRDVLSSRGQTVCVFIRHW